MIIINIPKHYTIRKVMKLLGNDKRLKWIGIAC